MANQPNSLEQAASKVMGAAKVAKGALHGMSGVFRTLMEEHGEVSALMMRVKKSNDPEVRARLFPKIRKELLSHEKGEMAVLYPEFAAHPETAQIAREHNAEAPRLEAAIQRVHALDYADPTWEGAFEQLIALVEHHVKEEEISWFPQGNRVFAQRADELNARFKDAKASALSSIT